MNITHLFLMQSELDAHIEEIHPRKEGESRHKSKVLALLVEIGELANETRCFKFWSHKGPSEREIILEELVDGIHFLLSIGLENGVENVELESMKMADLETQFLGVYNACSILNIAFSEFAYSAAFSAYIGLSEMLGYTWDEVEAAYGAKNTINHARQRDLY